ncbi:MAG: phage tail protein [Candidatus Dechloromonas phosphoritropha]|jgi:phage tail-like protein
MSNEDADFDYASLLPELLRHPDSSPTGAQEPSAVLRLLAVIDPMFADFELLLDDLSDYFDPLLAREDFLPWLASWTALVLRADWSAAQKREVLTRIIPLYRKRGTKAGLEEYLKIYAGDGVSILDELDPMQVGVTATVGVDTVVEGLPAHFFRANVAFTTPDPAELSRKTASVRAVLDIEKPAHTYYNLSISGPTFQIGERSTVGKDTLI